MPVTEEKQLRKPAWLRPKSSGKDSLHNLKRSLRASSLHTVCESARCPNIAECFSRNTATFMIMGDICTRNCRFCAVGSGAPGPLDPDEPARIARMVKDVGLKHAVITSVTRDDLPDGGATHFAKTITEIRDTTYDIRIEVLTPDFSGDKAAIDTLLEASPDIFNHNLETVERLTPVVRDKRASYRTSLGTLSHVRSKNPNITLKSGIMVGIGENDEEIFATLDNLARVGCDIVTVGQYLQPRRENLPVQRYVEPKVFDEYARYGESVGIKRVFAGPLVRSSYMAGDIFEIQSSRLKAQNKSKA